MFDKVVLTTALLLALGSTAEAGHFEGEETNVVMLLCVVDTTKSPVGLYVEALSSNTTKSSMPLVRTGEQCAQALHEFLTAGFEIVNKLTATDQFLLIRKDRTLSGH